MKPKISYNYYGDDMSNEELKLLKAVKEAAASVWLDDLPLSPTYVRDYTIEKLNELKMESPVLILQRGDNNGE